MKINIKETFENIFYEHSIGLAILLSIFTIAIVLGLAFGVFCLQGWIFMLLWNWLAVALFGAKVLGYWMCVGIVFALNFLGRIIFGRSNNANSDE